MELACDLPHAKKDGTIIQMLKVSITPDGGASVWTKTTTESPFGEEENAPKVLHHSLTTIDGRPTAPKFSVIVVEAKSVSKQFNWDHTYPPRTYYVDWGRARLAVVYAPAEAPPGFPYEPTAIINARWQCKRTD